MSVPRDAIGPLRARGSALIEVDWLELAHKISLGHGRALRFAPDWECSEAHVIFDRNSGDYWVVSLLAWMAVQRLQKLGAMTLAELEGHLDATHLYADVHAALQLTLQSLADNGLVQTER